MLLLAIVTLQGAWIVVQTIARASANLPVTCLELMTLAYVACAFLTYLIFINKPQDFQEPTLLEGDWVRSVCAAMYMHSRISTEKRKTGDQEVWAHAEIEYLLQIDQPGASLEPSVCGEKTSTPKAKKRKSPVIRVSSLMAGDDIQSKGEGANDCVVDVDYSSAQRPFQEIPTESDTPKVRVLNMISYEVITKDMPTNDSSLALYSNDVLLDVGFGPNVSLLQFGRQWSCVHVDLTKWTRWKLASEAFRQNPEIRNADRQAHRVLFSGLQTGSEITKIWKYPNRGGYWHNYIDPEAIKIAMELPSGHEFKLIPTLALCLGAAIFGSIHMAGWNGYFASTEDRGWWRGSSVLATVSGTLFYIGYYGMLPDPETNIIHFGSRFGPNRHWTIQIVSGLVVWFSMILMMIAMAGTMTARGALVVISILTLWQYPEEAFLTPHWTQYIPHL